MIRIGGSAKVVKKAVAPASRKGLFFFISPNDFLSDHQNIEEVTILLYFKYTQLGHQTVIFHILDGNILTDNNMFQNRVDPFGNIIKTPERGAWMGNRGVIHNHQKEIVRPYKLKTWITCVLQFKGRHREVMSPDRWTELFFMDEATAFSAGHRPCAECRRQDFNRFKQCWIAGNAEAGFNLKTPIGMIDNFVHMERIDKKNRKKTHKQVAGELPDGSMVMIADRAYVKKMGRLYEWSPGGYKNRVEIPGGEVDVLTPPSFVKTFQAGYIPQIAVD